MNQERVFDIVCQYCGHGMVAGHITINAAPAHLRCAYDAGDVTKEHAVNCKAKITCTFPACNCANVHPSLLAVQLERHADHCLCDSCVTKDNMDERIELSSVHMERNRDTDKGGESYPVMPIKDVTDFDSTGKFQLGVMPDKNEFLSREVDEDFQLITMGINRAMGSEIATRHGLLVEFIWSLHQAAKSGKSLPESIGYALKEWSI